MSDDGASGGASGGDSGGDQQAGPRADLSKMPGLSAIRADQGAAYLAEVQAQLDAAASSEQSSSS